MLPKRYLLFVTLLCLYACGVVVGGKVEDKARFDECIKNETVKDAFNKTATCFKDVIEEVKSSTNNTSCKNATDFKHSYIAAMKVFGQCSPYFKPNQGIHAVQRQHMANFTEHSLDKAILNDFIKNNSTECLKDPKLLNALVQCVSNSTSYNITASELHNYTTNPIHWIQSTKKLNWNTNTTCVATRRNKECFNNIERKQCTEPIIKYLTSLCDVFLDVCNTLTHPIVIPPQKLKDTKSTRSIVIACVLVIMAVAVIGILFKHRHQISSKIKSRRTRVCRATEERNVAFSNTRPTE